MLLAFAAPWAAMAQTLYTSYTFIGGTNTNDPPRQLVDNNKSTRWLVLQQSTYANSPAYCQFQSAAPITPVGYVITTGSDSGTWHRRNPKKWKIEASTDNSTWVTLHEITDGGLPHQDKADKEFSFENSTAYQYFKLTVTAIEGTSSESNGWWAMQLNEFQFKVVPNSGGDSGFILNQNLNEDLTCGGSTYNFYDSGGASGGYSSSESYTAIFTCTGDITITFNSFAVESYSYNYDYLTLYDGETQIAKLGGSGSTIGGNITTATSYTATSGTLKAVWKSDSSQQKAGWDATITTGTCRYITEIRTPADWNAFCSAVNSGHDYSGETVTLKADISITSQSNQAGSDGNLFKGTFDGNGHTITVNMIATGPNCAPFYGVENAAINNLIVKGNITSAYTRIGGISGAMEGNCTYTNCLSDVNITSTKTDGDVSCGGFNGFSSGSANPTFVGCAFTGSLTASQNNCGGFIGFHGSMGSSWAGDYKGRSTYTNCLFAPSSINVSANKRTAVFTAGYELEGNHLQITVNNSYYNEEGAEMHLKQGTRAYSVTGQSPVNVERSGDANTTYDVSGIAAYTGSTNKGLNFTQGSTTTIYAGSGETVALTLSGASTYEADHGTLAGSGSSYSLTMAASNTIISGISCAVPTNLQCTYYNRTSVTLAWTAGGDEEAWQVKYWPTNQTEPGDLDGNTMNVSTNPYTLTNLTQGQTYYVKVRAKCDENDFSDWSTAITVTPQALTYLFTNNGGNGDGQWNTLDNWQYSNPSITVTTLPTINDNVQINAACTIPTNCTAQANEITFLTDQGTVYGSITIEDGGQLQHSNTGVNLTIQRNIDAYQEANALTNLGYKIISFPVSGLAPTNSSIRGLITDSNNPYDFYTFDYMNQNQEDGSYLEWVKVIGNYDNDGMEPTTGYLYASQNGTTISVTGEVAPSSANVTHPLSAVTGDEPFNGWYLMGNPFVCNAYLTANGGNLDFYEIEDHTQAGYADFVLNDNTVAIPPMGGVMVWLHDDDNLVYSRTAPNSKGPGILNMDVNKASMRGTTMLDRARVRFGEGRNLKKLQLNPRHTKLYIPEDGNDFSVYYAEGAGTIPVNFKAQDNGRYTLDFSTEEVGFNYLHLIDNMNGNDVDLLQTPYYAFDAKSTDFASRFTLVFATGNDNDDTFAFFNNGVWIINNDGDATLQVVDALGRVLSSESISGSTSKAINVAPGVYMLRLINGDKVKVQKIVVKR